MVEFTIVKKKIMKDHFKAYTIVSREFLYRSIYFFFCFLLCLISSWIYEKELLVLYLDPLLQLNQNVIYTSISEAFYTSLRLCLWTAFSSCLPYGFYSYFCFFLPSFFPLEKKIFYKAAFYFFLCYLGSFVFCRVYIIPELCSWFLNFGVSTEGLYMSLQAKVSNYLSWSGKMYILSFCVLEIPVGFWILFQLGICSCSTLFFSQNRKIANCAILLLCAIISPPDVYSQGFIFFFSMVLIEYVLWYSFLKKALNFQRKKKTLKKGQKPAVQRKKEQQHAFIYRKIKTHKNSK